MRGTERLYRRYEFSAVEEGDGRSKSQEIQKKGNNDGQDGKDVDFVGECKLIQQNPLVLMIALRRRAEKSCLLSHSTAPAK